MDDVVSVKDKILGKEKLLCDNRREIDNTTSDIPTALNTYERELAKTLIKLRNGEEFLLDGIKVKNPPVSILKDIAKGICSNERLQLGVAESKQKALLSASKSLQAELNSLQSINKNLSHI